MRKTFRIIEIIGINEIKIIQLVQEKTEKAKRWENARLLLSNFAFGISIIISIIGEPCLHEFAFFLRFQVKRSHLKKNLVFISSYRYNAVMCIKDLLKEKNMTRYRLAVESGVPHTTLSDIISGRTRIEKCSGETLYRLSKVLEVPIEELIQDSMIQAEIERSYEHGLPEYLQNDLDAYKKGLKEHSSLLDCLWGELYGSINAAEISEGSITPAHAAYLREKYL